MATNTTRTPALEIFRGNVGEPGTGDHDNANRKSGFFWRLRAANGEIVADGAEGYTRRSDAVKAAERSKVLMAEAVVEVIA